jgi:hypothetical protein
MGRKKKRDKQIIFCYYCDRIYENERVLIQHQRAKHFKCPQCHKRISTAQGMMVHMFQVHKETIEHVPGAKDGRDSFEVEIFGMDGVPAEVVEEKRIKVFGEAAKKKPKKSPQVPQLQPIAQPQAHEIKIPGTRNVFSIGPPRTPSVNPMMMMGMPGMPMYPGMPFPGMPQVLQRHMPLQVSPLQMRPPTIPPPPMAISHMGGRILIPPPAQMIAPPPTAPPPKIAPPPVESLPDFPNIPPPQFNKNLNLSVMDMNSAPNAPPPKLALEEAPKISQSGEPSSKTPSNQTATKSSNKDSTEAIKKLPLPVEKNSVQNEDEALNKTTNHHKDRSSKASTPIATPQYPEAPVLNTQSSVMVAQKTSLSENNAKMNNGESSQTPSAISTSQNQLPASEAPVSQIIAPRVPPPKIVPPPTGPPVNSAVASGALPRIPVTLLSNEANKPSSTISPKPIQYQCPAPGTRKGRSPIIPVQPSSKGQPVGRYVPQVSVPNSPPTIPPPQLSQAPPIAGALDKAPSPKKKKSTIRIYNEKDVSQEEKRAMHPKYSGHLTKRIDSLSESIEERLKLLN